MAVQMAVPDSVQDYQAAQFLVNPVTAYAFLEAIAVPKGEWLLQNAANSVLGKEVGDLTISEHTESDFELRQRKGDIEKLRVLVNFCCLHLCSPASSCGCARCCESGRSCLMGCIRVDGGSMHLEKRYWQQSQPSTAEQLVSEATGWRRTHEARRQKPQARSCTGV